MPATTLERHTEPIELLYQSVVDEEFRALLATDPGRFGLTAPIADLPAAVEPRDDGLLDAAADGGPVMCKITCTWGMTQLCDAITVT